MNADQIQNFLESKTTEKNQYVKIDFKTRDTIYGLFVTGTGDYKDLSSKNFWRIVTRKNFDAYSKSKNQELARIFNGAEFTKLTLLSDGF